MSTPTKHNPAGRPAAASTAPYTSPVKGRTVAEPRGNQTFLFDRSNYMWMLIGLACILLGFVLLSGGKSPDPHQFNYEEIYSARRITIAPLLMLVGFAIEAYAIMKKPAVVVEDRPTTV